MSSFIIFFLGMGIGGALEFLYAKIHGFFLKKPLKKNHTFTLSKEISMLSLPIWGLIALLATGDVANVQLFIASAVVGTAFEYSLGKTLYFFFGVQVWTYHYGALGKFTSIYSIPYWGGAGIIFLTLATLL